MKTAFRSTIAPDGVSIEAVQRGFLSWAALPTAEWLSLTEIQGRAASVLFGLQRSGDAEVTLNGIRIDHCAAARLPASIADALGLPPVASLSATISFIGRVDSPEGSIRVRWYDSNLRVVNAKRSGAFLSWGNRAGRLNGAFHDLLKAIEGFNDSIGLSPEQRIALWQPVQTALQQTTGVQIKDEYLKSLNIYQAGSFALDVRQGIDGPDFAPVLMARSKAISLEDETSAPEEGFQEPAELRDETADALLPPELQRQFVERQFLTAAGTRDAYVLGRNTFLVLDPDLRAALDVVRRLRTAPADWRRDFIRNPRPAIAEALQAEGADRLSTLLFIETKQYSERVEGLAKWDPPKLPWLQKKAGQWLPETFPLKIGNVTVQVTAERFAEIVEDLAWARSTGKETLQIDRVEHAAQDVESAVAEARRDLSAAEEAEQSGRTITSQEDLQAPQPAEHKSAKDRHVLKIKANIEEVDFEITHHPRAASITPALPSDRLGATVAKPHQLTGFDWLVQAWKAGWPGVLLADDMGLGKTFQALAFLAWVKLNEEAQRTIRRGPVLVVAPVALLRTWPTEAALHLAPGALGDRIDAFGSELRRLKRDRSKDRMPEDALDVETLRGAGWILTTYETLADNHRAFARIAFSVAVFDEMQKVKAPGTINTHAAKAMNADFVIGLTGTPIENRLEDLWCIMDRIAPGYLGDLKSFSAAHKDEDPEALKILKARLDQPQHAAPAVMLRRMKDDILEGLPAKTVQAHSVTMPSAQAEAYSRAVREAQSGERTIGAMLKAIHALRGISLHPDGGRGVDGYDTRSAADWVSKSARITEVMRILRLVEERGEKALVFVEDRMVQLVFAEVLTTVLGLRVQPSIINGETPGPKRQAMVDAFQAMPPGFAVLILSPRAAGIGLTITAANHVIHLSRWWNPAVEDQCNDRVYRIGQTKPVTVHVPIARHPDFGDSSFDVTLDDLLYKKRGLSRHMLSPPVSDTDVHILFGKSVVG